MQKYFKQITLVAVLLTIAVNAAAEIIPFNGISTATVSDKYHTLLTPAGFTFIIWGVIYIGWLAYAIYPLIRKTKVEGQLLKAFPYFMVTAIANMLWLWLWHTEQLGWSVVVMLVLLVTLIITYLSLQIGLKPVSLATKLMIHLPVSIYLGWISVATIANVSSALVQVSWNGGGTDPGIYVILLLLTATSLGILMLRRRRDFGYAAVIVWALVGIAAASTSVNIVTVCGLCIIALCIYALSIFLQHSHPSA